MKYRSTSYLRRFLQVGIGIAGLVGAAGALAEEGTRESWARPKPRPSLRFASESPVHPAISGNTLEALHSQPPEEILPPPSETAPHAVHQVVPAGPMHNPYASGKASVPPGIHGAKRRGPRSVHAWLKATHWGYADHFVPTPFGESTRWHFGQQVANGMAAQMTLYHYDFGNAEFGGDAAQLSPRGRRQLAKIADRLTAMPVPVIIEPTADPALNEARRQNVLRDLHQLFGYLAPPEQIIVGPSPAAGLPGIDAALIEQNRRQQMLQGGSATPTGTEAGPITSPGFP